METLKNEYRKDKKLNTLKVISWVNGIIWVFAVMYLDLFSSEWLAALVIGALLALFFSSLVALRKDAIRDDIKERYINRRP